MIARTSGVSRFNIYKFFFRYWGCEVCFRRKVGIGSRSPYLLREACKRLVISLIDARGNDDTTLGVR